MGKIDPEHVELILEINKTVIVAFLWFLYYLTYMDITLYEGTFFAFLEFFAA